MLYLQSYEEINCTGIINKWIIKEDIAQSDAYSLEIVKSYYRQQSHDYNGVGVAVALPCTSIVLYCIGCCVAQHVTLICILRRGYRGTTCTMLRYIREPLNFQDRRYRIHHPQPPNPILRISIPYHTRYQYSATTVVLACYYRSTITGGYYTSIF